MSTEENKALIRRLVEAVNQRGMSAFEEAKGPNFVSHAAPPAVSDLHDVHRTIDDVIAEDDKVMLRFTGRGTHGPTGKTVTWTTIHVYRVAGGKLVEHWGIQDRLGVLQQLGMVPAPATP